MKLSNLLDYPLGDDQRASWKHWRWYDSFYNRWVENTPRPSRKYFDPNYIEKRQMIHEQDSVSNDHLYPIVNIYTMKKLYARLG